MIMCAKSWLKKTLESELKDEECFAIRVKKVRLKLRKYNLIWLSNEST